MKKKFSKHWRASKQPRKQRKYLANAPLHLKRRFLSANLSKELRKKYSRRSFALRKGDGVKIMRGSFKGKKGKISEVNLKKTKISIEGMQRQKKDGTKVNVFFHPSNLQIQELNLDDRKRIKSLERKSEHKTISEETKEKEKTEEIKKSEKIVEKKLKEKRKGEK